MTTVRINEQHLADIAILSNTPSFLFRRFRRDPSVQALSERLSEYALAKAANQYGTHKNRSYLDKVYSYAYIVALSFKSAAAIRSAIKSFPPPPIEWADDLLRQAIAEATSETRRFFTATPPTPKQLSIHPINASITQKKLMATTRPTVMTSEPVLSHNVTKVIDLAQN